MPKYTYTFDQLRNLTEEQILAEFMPYSWIQQHGGVKPDNYWTADHGTIEAETEQAACELLYARYNISRPEGYTGRSMSVSDIVNLWDDDQEEPVRSSWYCNSIGFVRIGE